MRDLRGPAAKAKLEAIGVSYYDSTVPRTSSYRTLRGPRSHPDHRHGPVVGWLDAMMASHASLSVPLLCCSSGRQLWQPSAGADQRDRARVAHLNAAQAAHTRGRGRCPRRSSDGRRELAEAAARYRQLAELNPLRKDLYAPLADTLIARGNAAAATLAARRCGRVRGAAARAAGAGPRRYAPPAARHRGGAAGLQTSR